MTFKDLKIGDTFDFINDDKQGYISFFHRCIKWSPRGYMEYSQFGGNDRIYTIGTIHCPVFHVEICPVEICPEVK